MWQRVETWIYWDQLASKLELELSKQAWVQVDLAAWAWGSPIAAAARQPRGGDSDCQYWVVEWRTLTPAAALRPRLRVPNCRCWVAAQLELVCVPAGREWCKGHCSDCQNWVVSIKLSDEKGPGWLKPAAALRPRLLVCGRRKNCLSASRVRTMLTLALPGEVLEFKGPVLVKANKSQGQILWNLNFLFLF